MLQKNKQRKRGNDLIRPNLDLFLCPIAIHHGSLLSRLSMYGVFRTFNT